MAIRKNVKRIDPRYFMDEKMEDPLNENNADRGRQQIPLRSPGWTEEDERRQKQYDKKKNKNPQPGSRGSADIDFTMQEDLSHLADPAVWGALVQAGWKLASIWGPMVGIAGFGIIIKDAIEYLKKSPESSHDDALYSAIEKAESGSKTRVDESLGGVGPGIAMMQADKLELLHMEAKKLAIEFKSATTGEQKEDIKQKILMLREKMESIKAASKNLKELMSEKTINALSVIREKADNLGDVENFNQEEFLKVADDKTKNAIKILFFLGRPENRKKWYV